MGTSSFGGIASGATGSNAPAFTFTVDLAAGYNHPIPFSLSISANGGAYMVNLSFSITTRSANEPVGGTITEDTVWTSDKTYIVNANLGIPPGITLTIQSGTEVRFNGNYNLNVGGMLIAGGTSAQPIRFLSHTGANWGRIFFDDPGVDATATISGTYLSGSILRWVEVESAAQGIGCTNATPYLSNVAVDGGGVNCTPGGTPVWVLESSLAGGLTIEGGGYAWGNTITNGGLSISSQTQALNNVVNAGISVGSGSTVQNNTAAGAINAPGDSTVTENTVSGGGIVVGSSALVSENTVKNGSISASNTTQVLTNTITGGGINAGNGSTIRRNDIEGSTGWGISTTGSVTVLQNRLVGNAGGIYTGGGLVQGNLIANSHGVGIEVHGDVEVISNTLHGNAGSAIKLVSGTSIDISGNNLEFNKGAYDVEDRIPKTTLTTVPANNNWWGTTNNAAIEQRIWDFGDDYNMGQVLYALKASGPVQTAPAYVRSVTLDPPSPVGIQTAAFDVQFSRPMDITEIVNLQLVADLTGRRGPVCLLPVFSWVWLQPATAESTQLEGGIGVFYQCGGIRPGHRYLDGAGQYAHCPGLPGCGCGQQRQNLRHWGVLKWRLFFSHGGGIRPGHGHLDGAGQYAHCPGFSGRSRGQQRQDLRHRRVKYQRS